ncbi:hybrid sensor histidine kinase/response regulator [Candidatus Magnetominusculus xianensis]|uniref:histidine kinase n=1 Tax=Candidatus Magnetominusculus xianensis TaxID=1748249 RepID=A0ABR5SI44_9BACT|nr:hybrid sensor histidine kinase/response regulator [Candidatus Magnetominusculus xianensis]KWT90169.1 chemotaxis protein CheA [Candidatus Magnetominusculus xianensis]
MIEDKELREIFNAETQEHIQNIEDGLLQLEKQEPVDKKALMEGLFREAHSLKGSARQLGVNKIELLGHTLEDMLNAAKRGLRELSPDMVNGIYKCLDAIKELLEEAVMGKASSVNVTNIIAELKAAKSAGPPPVAVQISEIAKPAQCQLPPEIPAAPPKEAAAPPVELMPAAQPEVPEIPKIILQVAPADKPHEAEEIDKPQEAADMPVSQEHESPAVMQEGKRFTIDTIRVETYKLDALMLHVGELLVMKNRINQRLTDIEETVHMWNTKVLKELRGNAALNKHKHIEDFSGTLNNLKGSLYEDDARLSFISKEIEERARTLMLLPLSNVFNPFKRMVRDLANQKSKEIDFVVEGGETKAEKRILEEVKDPLMHIIRNSIDHGIETPDERLVRGKSKTGTITVKAYKKASNIIIEVIDDGRGLNVEKIKETAIKNKLASVETLTGMPLAELYNFIFMPGFTTSPIITDISGRGVGMDVVKTALARLKGTVSVDSTPTQGCRMTISLPVTVSTTRVFIVKAAGKTYALPIDFVRTTYMASIADIYNVEGQKTITFDNSPMSVVHAADILELKGDNGGGLKNKNISTSRQGRFPCIVFTLDGENFGVMVDTLVDEQEIVIKSYGGILKSVRNVIGSTILGTGEVCMVLNPADILKTIKTKGFTSVSLQKVEAQERPITVLVAEDSITTRTQLKRILEGAGYEVTVSVDGMDALRKLELANFDAVVSDVEMPNMNGLVLTEAIRKNKKYKELPVILVTTLSSEEDMRKGAEVGANAYITKPAFDRQVFLDTLKRLI